MLEIVKCKCDFQINPLGIDNPEPAFGWQLQSEESDVMQESYLIAVQDEREKEVWNSGWIKSSDCIGIRYQGRKLESRTAYFWRVYVKDRHGREAVSGRNRFETAFLRREDWKAEWISPKLPEIPEEKEIGLVRASLFPPQKLPKMIPCTHLYRQFRLKQGIRRARVYAAAHGVYCILMNGQKLGDQELAPGFSAYQKVIHYQTYDASELLRDGENAVGIILADGWYGGHIGMSGSNRQYGNKHALLFQLEVEYDNGSTEYILSDEHFRCTDSGPFRYSDLFVGERYDARREIAGFGEAGLDVSNWHGVVVEPEDMGKLRAFYGEPVRRVMEIKPKEIRKTPKGETVIDLGQNIAGRIRLRVTGQRGREVVLEHSEILDAKGNFLMNIVGVNKHQKDVYILKGDGVEEYEPQFTFHGFRYVRVTGYPGVPTVDDFTAVVIASDMENTGSFRTSNPIINRLQSNIVWSQRGNMVSIPTDCPQREKAGWTGDIQVYGPTAMFNQNVSAFLKRWLESLRADQYADGAVPFLSPFVRNYRENVAAQFKMISSAGWSDACLIVPYELYLRYGDVGILEENYEMMSRYMRFVQDRVESGEWFSQFHFGDWLLPSVSTNLATSTKSAELTREFVAAAYHVRTTELMAEIARILNQTDDVEMYQKNNQKSREFFREKYVSESGVFQADYQGMYVLALKFDLIPEKYRPAYIARLKKRIEDNQYRLDTGFLSVPFIMDILCDNGMTDIAYKLLFQEQCPSWLYEVNNGATTLWENWRAITPKGKRQNMSYNHYAYGCVGDWMYRRIAGIEVAAPGYRRIKIRPIFGHGFTFAEAKYDSVLGMVKSRWEQRGDTIVFEAEIPCNSEAAIELDGITGIQESSIPAEVKNGKVVAKVGSGRVTFVLAL